MREWLLDLIRGHDISCFAMALRFIAAFAVVGLVLFGGAGTIFWVEAWLLILLQFLISIRMYLWLYRHDQALLKSRLSYFKPALRQQDRRFAMLFSLLFAVTLLLSGADAVRIGWSDMPVAVKSAGFLAYGMSMWLVFMVMQQNSFASPIVEIQSARSHVVVDTGLYAHVRHPMYSGFIGALIAFPLALGSWLALMAALVVASTFFIRIVFEEDTLVNELPDYAAYCRRVRYRLIPGVW